MTSFLSAVAMAAATLSPSSMAQEAGSGDPSPSAVTASASETAPQRPTMQGDDILVNRTIQEERKQIRDLARNVLGRISSFEPLPHFQDELCLNVIGIKEEHLEDFRARIIENAQLAQVRIADDGCYPNALVAIIPDARGELKTLAKTAPIVFSDLPASAKNRMLNSRDEAFAFQATEILGANGTQVNIDPLTGGSGWDPVSSPNNMIYGMYGRVSKGHSINFRTSVVVIDADAAGGKTAMQLADYASLRLLMPTKEIEQINENAPETIMSLFMDPKNAPAELTNFDLGFLQAGYRMARNIAAGAVFEQTARVITNPKAR